MQFTKLSEVSTASEAFNMNTLLGTYLYTSATACTLIIINYCEIILNLNCAVRTGLLTLHTSDTTVRASLVGYSALIVAGALNSNSGLLGENVNNTVGTGLFAKTASDTLGRINLSNTVFDIDVDSILRTNCDTVAVAKTSIGTNGVARVSKLCSLTGLNTVVNVFSVLGLAVTVTSNVSNLGINVACSKTQDFTDLSSYVCAAGDTKAGVIALTLAESLCVSIAAGVTARTTVSAGETVTDCNYLFVLLNCEERSCYCKHYCADKSYYCKNN